MIYLCLIIVFIFGYYVGRKSAIHKLFISESEAFTEIEKELDKFEDTVNKHKSKLKNMNRCTKCGRVPFFCKCNKKEDEVKVKPEMLEPFITLEKKGIRPVISFTQTQYMGVGEIHKKYYGGYHKAREGLEEYTSVGDGFNSATEVMKAILKAVM